MDISVLQKKDNKLTLRVQGVSPSYINALRRVMMTEVPVLAVEDVEFRKNSGALYDEFVAHRLGMLSIKTDGKSYNLPSECKCKGAGCAQCQVKLTLQAVGPKTVYAEEIKSQDPGATPVHGKAPITKLLDGQEIELEATAVMGKGMDHAKWNAGLIHYKEYPHVTIKSQPENAKELASEYPEICEIKGGKLAIKEDALPFYDIHEEVISKANGSITVDYKDDYVLVIESWEQRSPKDILLAGLEVTDKQLDEMKALVKEV